MFGVLLKQRYGPADAARALDRTAARLESGYGPAAELAAAGIGVKPAYCFTETVTEANDYFRVGYGEEAFPRALAALANFQALIDDLDQSSETLPLDELTEHAIDVTGRELLATNGATTSALPHFAALILETA